MLVKSPQLILGKMLHTDESIARAFERRHDLVQLQLHRLGVLVLGALDQKDHQEGHDAGDGVDHQLPTIGKVEDRTRHRPGKHEGAGDGESPRAARPVGGCQREPLEGEAEPALLLFRLHRVFHTDLVCPDLQRGCHRFPPGVVAERHRRLGDVPGCQFQISTSGSSL